MRVDFNVPLNDNGEITDDTRIKAVLSSINYVLEKGGALIIMSHLGKPKGVFNTKYSLAPCAKRLSKLLGRPVLLAFDCISEKTKEMAKNLKPGEILLLENLRFYKAEENPEDDPDFAKQLAELGDVYVNDAFGTAHRAHSSTAVITRYFPHKAAFGFLMEKEIQYLGQILLNPKKPFFAILGGAKISSKMGIVKQLLGKVDALFIGGGMAYTFQKAKGFSIGKSLFEEELIETCKEIMQACEKLRIPLYLPEDYIIADAFSNDAQTGTIGATENFPPEWQGMSIGPKTVESWKEKLKTAGTIFWNGPLGVFELPKFAKSTESIAKIIADTNAVSIIGGGDSVAAINSLGIQNKFSHLSTGGGATLEYIEKGKLPGIEALSDKYTETT